MLGTETITEVDEENTDQDPMSFDCLGTETYTASDVENSNEDPHFELTR